MKTLVLLKPDVLKRRYIGPLISRIEDRFNIQAMRMLHDFETLELHYEEHKGKDFYEAMMQSMDGPLIAMLVEHRWVPDYSVALMRAYMKELRLEFAVDIRRNSIHASEDIVSAHREMGLWFPDDTSH